MSGQIAFPLCDGQLLSIRIATESGEMGLDEVRDGSILWGFDAFLGDRVAKNKFCEEILAWPYRNRRELRNIRLEVSAAEQYRCTSNTWLGESFGLACAIAFAWSQADNSQHRATVVATGVMRRVDNHLLVDPVEGGEQFTHKLKGVLSSVVTPEYFIYPSGQPLSPEHQELLSLLQDNGTRVLAVESLHEVCEYGICPPVQHGPHPEDQIAAPQTDPIIKSTYVPGEAVDREIPNNEIHEAAPSYSDANRPETVTRPAGLVGAGQWSNNVGAEKQSTNRLHLLGRFLAPLFVVLAIWSMWPMLTDIWHGQLTEAHNTLSQSEIDELTTAIKNDDVLRQYDSKKTHKAFAFSESGAGGWSYNIVTADAAARISLEICRSYNDAEEHELPCRVVNIDGTWVSDYQPSELPEDVVSKAHLTESSALEFFEQKYKNINHRKVLAASLSGIFSGLDDPDLPAERLKTNALADCKSKNLLLEKRYPCQIINVDGEWIPLKPTSTSTSS